MRPIELKSRPAVGVTRKLAEAYAHHVGGELPSEAQWEFAARSRGTPQLYVWGNDPPYDRKKSVNINQAVPDGIKTARAGGSTDDHTEQGILDLAGNVREWCRDEWKGYSAKFEKDPLRFPAIDDAATLFVIRGGSYLTLGETARTTWRHDKERKDFDDMDLGFRVVLEIIEAPDSSIAHSEKSTGTAGERGL
jgi:serine/threonine-protein kinase